MTVKKPVTMGRCTETMCKMEYVLRKDGKIRKHNLAGLVGGRECPGSEHEPSHTWTRRPSDAR